MPRAVVILPSSTYRAADFLSAAEVNGIDLVVASEAPPPFDMGDRYVRIDCTDPVEAADEIARLADRIGVDAVVAADDAGVVTAAWANSLLGLAGNPPDAAERTKDKLAMRRRLAATEVDQPVFGAIYPDTDPSEVAERVGYPMVVKPTNRSASQGVIRIDRPEDLATTISRVRQIAGEGATLIAEQYMKGVEIAVEGLVTEGELTVLAIFDKPDTPSGPYFPETIFVMPSRLPESDQIEVERVAGAAIRGLGLTRGPVHVEMRIDEGRVRLIEVAARSIGGLCSRSLSFGLMGTTLEALILANALGTGPLRPIRQPIASGVLMIPTPSTGVLRQVSGEEEVRQLPGITGVDIMMVPGDHVVAPPDGERYLGFVYARGDSPENVESALRKAMTILEVQLES